MATVQTIINRALRLNGKLGAGRTPSSNDTADVLVALNAMLDSWRNERLMVYAISEVTHTLTVGDASYSIGSGGDIDTTRPVKIEDAFMRENDIDYPIRIITDVHEWNSIADKTTTGNIVEYLYYNPGMSTGTVNIYPVPTVANVIHLSLWTPLTAFSAATDTVTLPPGYERALAFNLAVEISPEYGEGITPLTVQIAKESKGAIKRVNRPSMDVNTELSLMFSPGRANIENDE